ncbi:hypothetical protein ACT2CV_09370 [Pasteurellaceae bacterium 22721_9_1]
MSKRSFFLFVLIYSFFTAFFAIFFSHTLFEILHHFENGLSILDIDLLVFFTDDLIINIKFILSLFILLFVIFFFGYGKFYNIL